MKPGASQSMTPGRPTRHLARHLSINFIEASYAALAVARHQHWRKWYGRLGRGDSIALNISARGGGASA